MDKKKIMRIAVKISEQLVKIFKDELPEEKEKKKDENEERNDNKNSKDCR